jgi:hypothetical protein
LRYNSSIICPRALRPIKPAFIIFDFSLELRYEYLKQKQVNNTVRANFHDY